MMRAATFDKRYEPVRAPSGSDFWTWDELQAAHPPAHVVWTVVEYNGKSYVEAGYHIVNAIGYTVTREPWTTGDEEARW